MSCRAILSWFFGIVFFFSTGFCLAGEDRFIIGDSSPAVAKTWAAGDTLVTDPTISEVKPSMTSAPNGDLWVAVEDTSGGWIRVYRSTDGGDTWARIVSFVGGNSVRNPSIAYGEHTTNGEKWLYVAFEQVEPTGGNRLVRIFEWDLVLSAATFITVDGPFIMASAGDEVHPQIITDLVEFGDLYYVYVTYAKYAIDYYPIYSARTTDRGATWSIPLNVTGGSENTGWATRPEIAYGFSGLFITFVKPGWNGVSWSNQIWLTESSNFGSSFETPVQLTDVEENVFHPAIAAAHGADTLVVAFTYDFVSETDIAYTSSTDGGTAWNPIGGLPWSFDYESNVDLAVSNSGGHFHAAYKHEGMAVDEIWYSSAAVADPTVWSPAVVINGGNTASATYPRPTIATMPGLPSAGEAAIAWADYRGAFYDVYFDTAAIFADGFESGDTSAWSSSVP